MSPNSDGPELFSPSTGEVAGREQTALATAVPTGLARRAFLTRSFGLAASASTLGALLQACGSSNTGAADGDNATPPKAPTGVLRIANFTEPTTLDPARPATAADFIFVRVLFDGLANFNDDYTELSPALATSWEQSDDGREWIFHLRPNVKFHDGEPVDSTAVRKSFEYFQTQKGSFSSFMLPPKFSKIDDSDPLVIHFATKAPFADLARNQALLRPISPRVIAGGTKAINKSPAGAGPFRYVRTTRERTVIAEANPDYWGKGPYIQRLEFPVVKDNNTRVSALTSGQVDLSPLVLPPQAKQLGSDTRRVKVETRDAWRMGWLGFITNQKPVDDVRVRKAIAYALDREAIAKAVLDGLAKPADSFMPRGVAGYKPPTTQYEYSPDKARALLAEAGHPNGVDLRFATGATTVLMGSEIAQAMVGQLKEAGIRVKLDVMEDAVLNKQLGTARPRFHMIYNNFSWVTGGPIVYSLGLVSFYAKYAAPAYLKLVERLNSLPDGAARNQVVAELQQYTADQLPVYGLFQHQISDAFTNKLRAYAPPGDGILPTFTQAFLA
jgi:peptide/nickel transport system substrate-binding protein